MNKNRIIKVLETIQTDMKDDARRFDGQPFTGKTMAEYNGYLGAAISGLAEIITIIVKELSEKDETRIL